MKNKKWGILIGIIVLVFLIGFIKYVRSEGRKSVDISNMRRQEHIEQTRPVTRRLIVSADKETEPVKLFDRYGHPLRMVPLIVPDNVPYIIHHNGLDGKFDEHILARNKRPPGWTSGNPGEGRTLSATFQLEPGYPDTPILYTLYPKE